MSSSSMQDLFSGRMMEGEVFTPFKMKTFQEIKEHESPPSRVDLPNIDYEVFIIGAGFSGLLAAIKLQDAGVPKESILMVDCAPDVGGVWQWNSYPGAACDVQSYFYLPMLGRTQFVPSKKYVAQEEIKSYIKLLAKNQGLEDRIKLNTLVTGLKFRESDVCWEISTSNVYSDDQLQSANKIGNRIYTARHCVVACGPIAVPKFSPTVQDLHTFNGPVIHSARWDHSLDLTGKRVGIIGTGTSAAQIITSVAGANYPNVKKLYVFQRTPGWCIPREDEPTPKEMSDQLLKDGNTLLRDEWMAAFEEEFYTMINDLKKGGGNEQMCDLIAEQIREIVNDKEVAEQLVPKIPFFCKRILVHDDYYQAYNNPKIQLIHDDNGVKRATPTGLETVDGRHVELDAIISATGFDVFNISIDSVTGRNGVSLHERWGGANHRGGDSPGQPRTVFGIHIRDFPNLYMMIGPQSLNPSTSVTFVSEHQADYIARIVVKMRKEGSNVVDVTKDQEDEWREICKRENTGKVWGKCLNWYNKEGSIDDSANFWGKEMDYFKFIDERKDKALHFSKL